MRGFSNIAAKPREDEGFVQIAKRFAPVRIVATNEVISGDLGTEQPIAMSWDLAKRSFKQGFSCLWNIKRVLTARAVCRMRIAYHGVMQSRYCAWALAGWGWSFSCGLGLMLVLR